MQTLTLDCCLDMFDSGTTLDMPNLYTAYMAERDIRIEAQDQDFDAWLDSCLDTGPWQRDTIEFNIGDLAWFSRPIGTVNS